MKRTLAALALLAAVPMPALAQTATAELRPLLAVAPVPETVPEEEFVFSFLSLSALRELSANPGDIDRPGWLRIELAFQGIRPLEALLRGPEVWPQHTGVAATAVFALMQFGIGRGSATLWALDGETSAAAVMATLPAKGFAPYAGAIAGMMANDEPGAMNFAAADAADPWRGPLGQSSFVAAVGPVLLQAVMPATLVSFARTPSALDQDEVAAMLDGVDAIEGTVRIVQANFFTSELGLAQRDIPALAPVGATAPIGIPPYSFGYLLDAVIDGTAALVIALAYDGCDAAEKAASTVVELWHSTAPEGETFAARVPVETSVSLISAENACAAIVVLSGGDTADGGNAAYSLAMRAVSRAEFAPIQILD